MKHGSLFSGIGGFDLASQWMGWENVFHCEIESFPRKILHHYWPNAISYEDIKKTNFTIHKGRIDIITGGFPCQPYSMAGKRKGKEDERHLWPEMLRAIREIQPRWVVGENVFGLINWNGGLVFDEVQSDLEAEGYEVQAYVLPAAAINAPHRRDRVWFVAYAMHSRNRQPKESTGEYGDGVVTKESSSGAQHTKQPNKFGDNGSAPDTNSSTTRTSGKSGSIESNGGNGHLQPEQRGGKAELNTGLHELSQDVANTDNNGQNECDSQHEINASERGINAQCDFEQMGGDVADTESKRTWKQSSEDKGWKNRRFDNNGKEGNVTDTDGIGFSNGCEQPESIQSGQPCRSNTKEDDANTERKRSERKNSRHKGTRVITGFLEQAWSNFPTQSPICGGNDGIPDRLDNITFSKWRNESIKGYGNAIVPQVVYQIFKAIEEYESI